MKEQQEASQLYSEGILEYLSGYEWSKVIAHWNMSANNGFLKIFDSASQEIRPQFYKDEKNREQPRRTAPESMRKADKLIKEYYQKCLNQELQKWNTATITIYPDGRYESEFIWDQQAHIDFLLLDMATAFSFIYSESDIKITDLMIPEQEWEKAVITILFVNGHILPLQIEVTTEQGIKQFSVPVQNLSYQEAPYLIKSFEDIYQLANEGELKQHFAPGWNTVIIYQDRKDRFNFEEHVHFELRDLS
ncbi:hypothetical protein [Xanthocytophaga flava]|uniref:hypothetical protein n=1 Tax=Xanthocytophaga flava TaxID=3048013 RepID=UPI0028D4CCFC|nr:hypothetical protein [Xanthocytophaga flavus]MDJ1472542.1 hypothetical protein [Xanthocytophaga flavus]